MKKEKLTVAASNPKPKPGTPEFDEWLREDLRRSCEFHFGPDAPTIDPELEKGFMCGDFEGLAMSDAERDKEDEEIEAEQRAYTRRHLKPV